MNDSVARESGQPAESDKYSARFGRAAAIQTGLALALALAVRLYVLVGSHGMIDSDEAVLGIQAERILRGAHPIYFSGQSFMGAWDAYLAAPIIALFGPSAAALHVVTLAESLLLVPLLGALAVRVFGTDHARLPAMFLAALPPLYVGVGELRMLGGYVETLVAGSALCLLTLVIAERWATKRPTFRLWLLVGLLTGLALWIDVLVICYMVTCALWLVPPALTQVARVRSDGSRWAAATKGAIGFIVAGVLGYAPAILYAWTPGQYVAALKPTSSALDIFSFPRLDVLQYFVSIDAPQVLGARLLWMPGTVTPVSISVMTLLPEIVLLLVLVSCVSAGYSLIRSVTHAARHAARHTDPGGGDLPAAWRGVFPVLLACAVSVVFWRNPQAKILDPNIDTLGRYLLPLTTAITLLIVYLYLHVRKQAVTLMEALLSSGVPLRPGATASAASLVLLVALLCSYASSYLVADKVEAFVSPYSVGMRFPGEGSAIMGYLEQHNIRYVWADHWAATALTYLTDEHVLADDYYDFLEGGVNRFPDIMNALSHADRPAFIVRGDGSTNEPWAASALRQMGVRYASAEFGQLWVVVPLTRIVGPIELLKTSCQSVDNVYLRPPCSLLPLTRWPKSTS